MTLKQKILLILFVRTFTVNSQDSLAKLNSVGLGVSCSAALGTPDFAKTFGAFYKHNRHQISAGLDIYNAIRSWGTIAGFQAGYQFCLNKPTKHFNAYAVYTFQYVQFGQGIGWYVPYNFLPTDDRRDFNLWRTRSLTNAFGLRIAGDFLKAFSIYAEIGMGCNYSKRLPSPTNQYYNMDPIADQSTNIIFTPFLKAGINFKLHKW